MVDWWLRRCADASVAPENQAYTALVKRRSALWLPFVAIHATLILGREWHTLAVIDGVAVGLLALGLIATQIWPDKIWIRGSR